MKFIINFLRFIIAFYLFALVLIAALFYSSKLYNRYPDIRGYTLYVVEDDKLESAGMPDGTLVILEKEKYNYTAVEGDYVLFKDGELYKLMEVKKENASDSDLDTYVVAYPEADESEYINVKKMDVIAKHFYHNPTLSLCYKILTNWMVLLVLILFLLLSPSLTYKRFEL